MAFVNMDFAQFYQPPKAAGICNNGRPAGCNLRLPTAYGKDKNPTALEPSKKGSRILQNDNTIEILASPPPKEPLGPFHMPALNLDGTGADPGDTLNRLITTGDHGRSNFTKVDELPTFEELLLDPGEVQEWPGTSSDDGHEMGGFNSNFECTAKNDHNSTVSSGSSEGKIQEKWTAVSDGGLEDQTTQNTPREAMCLDNSSMSPDVNDDMEFAALRKRPPPKFRYPSGLRPKDKDTRASSTLNKAGSSCEPIVIQDEDEDTDSSGNDTLEKQNGNQGPLSTRSTSVAGSEAGTPSLSQKNIYSTSGLPQPHYNALVSKYDEPVCKSEGGNHKSLTHNLSADDNKRDQQDNEAEMADEEERFSGDRDRDSPPLPYSTKMRPLSTAGEKAHMKRPIKRRHLSSAPLSKSQAPPRTDLYHGCRTASLGTGSLNSVANTPCPLESSQGQAYPTHEDKEWEIVRILRKRKIGKSYEYKIQWRNTWLPKSALGNAQALLKDFETKSQAKRGRGRGRGARMDEGQ